MGKSWAGAGLLLTATITLAGCSGAGSGRTATTSTSGATTSTSSGTGDSPGRSSVAAWAGSPVAADDIPLGDGKVSTSPAVGYQDSCTTSFPGAGGARTDVPWIDSSAGSWNATTKLAVQGSHSWPNAAHSFTVDGAQRVVVTDDLPATAATGTFPISPSDPAYQYDRNPNSVQSQSITWHVPAAPVAAAAPACTPLGPIAVATNGVVIFNALDDGGRDAGAHEVQDSCAGHPNQAGMYHYHDMSPCLETSATKAAGSSTLIGYALDGYGIYLERDAKGDLPTDGDLDACHGRTSTVVWDGTATTMYHYDVTLEYPYFVGCFHGTPVSNR